MRLGLATGYWGATPVDPLPMVLAAERLGFDSVRSAAAYGSDAVTLATLGRGQAGAVPDALVDDVALVGPAERIAERLQLWREAGVDTLIVGSTQVEALRVLAEAAG